MFETLYEQLKEKYSEPCAFVVNLFVRLSFSITVMKLQHGVTNEQLVGVYTVINELVISIAKRMKVNPQELSDALAYSDTICQSYVH